MRNWKQIAAAEGWTIPDAQLERIAPVLDALEAAFRPLVKNIPHQTQPCLIYRAEPESSTEKRP